MGEIIYVARQTLCPYMLCTQSNHNMLTQARHDVRFHINFQVV